MYSHIKLHCMIARVEHALFLIADDTRQRFIFYMIFVSSGGVYIHTAGNIRQIWHSNTFKLNIENKSSLFGLHFQQLFVWPLGGTAVNESTSFTTETSCVQRLTPLQPFLTLH